VRYKYTKEDQKIPHTVADLLAPWNEMQHRTSPCCIIDPNNSDGKEEEDINDEEGEEMGIPGLVFEHDESEYESDISRLWQKNKY